MTLSREEITDLFINAKIKPFIEMYYRFVGKQEGKENYTLYLFQILCRDGEVKAYRISVGEFIDLKRTKDNIKYINETKWEVGTTEERLTCYAEFINYVQWIFKSLLAYHGYNYYPLEEING